jgi:uncharacterized protein YecE (DUF72 family)
MRRGKIHIGTSGWHYKHWKDTFYPAGIKESAQFAEYCRFFNTVEINNSFYRLPAPETFTAWRKSTARNFIFSVKASRFFTHAKKLNVDSAGHAKFFTHVSKLEEKLGPILFQLPPKWKVNPERLRSFIQSLPKGHRYTFEFREPTWYNNDVYTILRENNCAFCIYELNYHLSPMEVTADFVYVRLHGPGDKYQGSYKKPLLKKWAARCQQWQTEGKDVFVYFDNDQEGFAAFNAVTLMTLLK